MGNESCRSLATLIEPRERDPNARIERLMNLERNSVEAKLTALKRESNTAAVQSQIDQYQKLLDTMNYFSDNGGIIEAKEKHENQVQQIQFQVLQSKQEEEDLKLSLQISDIQCNNQEKQLGEAWQKQKKANEEIFNLQAQIQIFEEECLKETQGYEQQIQYHKKQNNNTKKNLQQGLQKYKSEIQNQLVKQKQNEESNINQMSQQNALFQSRFQQKNQDIEELQNEMEQNQIIHQNQVEKIQRESSEQMKMSIQQLENRLNSEFNNTMVKKQKDWDQQKKALESQISNFKKTIEQSKQALK